MAQGFRRRCLRLPLGFIVVTLGSCFTTAVADSFETQFSSPTYYGLAVAGISLGAAISAALLGLLIYCLLRRRRKAKRERHQRMTPTPGSKTNTASSRATAASGDRVDGGGGDGGGAAAILGRPVALPVAASSGAPAKPPQSSLPRNSATANGNGGGGGGDSKIGTGEAAAKMAKYINPAFNANESSFFISTPSIATVGGVGSDGRSPGGSAQLFRHSSALRPVPYASYESSLKSSQVGSSPAGSERLQQQQQVIQHAPVRTSPAGTKLLLDPRQYLSQGAIDALTPERQKRLSLAAELKLHLQPDHQYQQQPVSKRHSYAEQKSRIGSSVELASGRGQVFSVPGQHLLRFPLPTQPEEPSGIGARKSRVAPPPPPPPPRSGTEDGPAFPQPKAFPSPAPPQMSPPVATQWSSVGAAAHVEPAAGEQVPHRSLHRINLGGDPEDKRSVTSTVLKQDALKAFDFLDSYEDLN